MERKWMLTRIDLAITLLCAAFLFVTLGAVGSRGRHRAKDILCRSKLQKWYVAASMFTGDNDDSFWRGWMCAADPSLWWFEALQPYYGDFGKLCCCPTATQTEWNPDGTHGPGYNKQPFMAWGYDSWLDPHNVFGDEPPYGSYGANGWLDNKPDSSPYNSPKFWRYLSAVTTPSKVPLMTDAQWIEAWPEPDDRPPGREDVLWDGTLHGGGTDPDWHGGHFVRVLQNRHGDGWQNCAFLDGSARKVGLKELWVLKWHREYDTAGPWTVAGGATYAKWNDPVKGAPWMADFTDY